MKPNRVMLLAICWICFFEWVRALFLYGVRESVGRRMVGRGRNRVWIVMLFPCDAWSALRHDALNKEMD